MQLQGIVVIQLQKNDILVSNGQGNIDSFKEHIYLFIKSIIIRANYILTRKNRISSFKEIYMYPR